jgi:hypothetical protein
MRKLAYFAAVALLCTGIAVAQDQSQNPSSSPSAQQPSSSDQNQQASPSSTDQNQASPSGQAGQAGQAGAAEQGQAGQASATSDQTGSAHAGKKLPQTASPLPFLSLLGMGMMGVGGLRRYFKR